MIAKHLLDYDLLKQLYVERNMSINEIARRQGAHPGTVYNKLKQGTLKRGGTWPLRPPQPPRRKQSLVPICGVQGFVLDLKKQGVNYVEVARKAGVCERTIHQVVRPSPRRGSRIQRDTVQKIMRAVSYFERQLQEERAA